MLDNSIHPGHARCLARAPYLLERDAIRLAAPEYRALVDFMDAAYASACAEEPQP